MMRALPALLAAALLVGACAGPGTAVRSDAPKPAPDHGETVPSMISESHYRVYTGTGQPASIEDVADAMGEASVVFVGETHDDAVGHTLEMMLLASAYRAHGGDRPVALSLEMFARDVQYIVDEYLDSLITERHFLASSNPWPNYASDYRPMVEFARAHGLPVLASNAPRRYVNRVARMGPASLEALGEAGRAALAPLPYPAPSDAYRAKWDRLMGADAGAHGSDDDEAAAEVPGGAPTDGIPNMLHAQALWDATMAYSVAEYLGKHDDALVVHVVGGFHVAGGTGTPEALRHYRPETPTLNVALRPAADLQHFPDDAVGEADFVILTLRRPAAPARRPGHGT